MPGYLASLSGCRPRKMENSSRPANPEAVAEGSPRGDIIAGVVILLIAIVGWWTIRTNPELVGTDYGSDPGPAMVPQITLGLLVLSALTLMARGIVSLRRASAGLPDGSGGWTWLPIPAAMVASLVLYVLAFPVFGFVEATLFFSILWSIVLGAIEFRPRSTRSYFLYVAEAGLITFLVWLAFAKLIGIPLP